MSVGNLKNQGGKGTNYPFQYAVLKLLDQISTGISVIPGVDYETRTTMYQATAAGPGYSISDIIIRYDIIDVATSTVSATIWFNQTTQTAIAAPAPANLTPIAAPSAVTVINGAGGSAVNIQDGGNSITIDSPHIDANLSTLNKEATQLLIQALLTTIDGDTSNLDVLLSSRNAEATQLLIKALLTTIDGDTSNLDVALSTRATEATLLTRLSKADFEARINTLGQKAMVASTPVVLASDQTSIPVTSTPSTVARVPSVVAVPANTALSNTTAGVQEVSIRVLTGGNAQVGGVAVPNGSVITFRADKGDTVNSVSYQTGAGTTLVITYLT